MAAKDAAVTVLFHLSVQLWTTIAVHEKKSSADIAARSFQHLTWFRDGLSRPHLRAKRYMVKKMDMINSKITKSDNSIIIMTFKNVLQPYLAQFQVVGLFLVVLIIYYHSDLDNIEKIIAFMIYSFVLLLIIFSLAWQFFGKEYLHINKRNIYFHRKLFSYK